MDPSASTRPPTEKTLTATDGTCLFTRTWWPAGPPHAALLIVHGYAEHSGRYHRLAGHLTEAGYVVHAYDHRGFGRSEGRRGRVVLATALHDLDRVVAHLRQQAPGRALLMLGHSMGGTLAALYAITHQPYLAGLLLSSPALRIPILPPLQPLVRVLGRILPGLPTLPLDRRGLSHDPEVVRQAEADPLNYHGATPAGTAAALLEAGRTVLDRAAHLTLPLLITHGTADPIADPQGSEALYERAGATDKTLSLFEGFYHEPFNEPDGRIVIDTLTDWLEEHTPAWAGTRDT
ncbi:MAG: alpha/beta hydrolase [Bacteroidetes bacterium]|nr:hypothetical protein AWN76_006860 [Rhodothermaceae bacterium RA]RMH59012.1 MAG: alpha/beta hydrolase [Bacteroidota bacterium]